MIDPNELRRAMLESTAADIGELLAAAVVDAQVGEKWGFVVLLFSFGEGGDLAYFSNANREDCIKMMREWIEKAEAEEI